MITGGKLGELFTALAFASALVSVLAYFFSEKNKAEGRPSSWGKLGTTAFGVHIISVLGIIGTLFGMIYTHQYQYHYVWSHSSNELPVYYMISCFWEGQEGSFLLWMFWNSILGGILLRTAGSWRDSVVGVIASIELIITSMILGVYVHQQAVSGLFLLLTLLPAAWLAFSYFSKGAGRRNELPLGGTFRVAGILLGLLTLLLFFRGQHGFWSEWTFIAGFTRLAGIPFTAYLLGFMVFGILFFVLVGRAGRDNKHYTDVIAGLGLLVMGVVMIGFDPNTWKVGSMPFMLLKDALPDAEAYLEDPNFIPTNGSGLNPLLQNYWMVIHPPTLFLGFSATAVPFAYVVAGLLSKQYKEWIRPAMPWLLFSVMILGIGIIMGGYWAYETLNFGGYWNWDPVENSSLVPWIVGVASLHAMLIYQKSRTYLHLTIILIISTFLLVLYSTFLTRSGILGETSVHTFTDLGLSGQLLLLVLIYFVAVLILLAVRWRKIPTKPEESKVWSAEFFLFLGVLVLVFAGAEIILTTSLPVFNKILGTNMAPPAELSFFYYQWNVFFAVGFGVFSGIGQFLWWKVAGKRKLSDAIFRPFLMAVVTGCIILILMTISGMEFAFDSFYRKLVQGENSTWLGQRIVDYLQYGFFNFANEILLFSSLFAVFAGGDVLVSILRRSKKGLKVMGGTVVHIGFGLMLLGILFSSGYGDVVSRNLTPEELSGFPEKEKVDNVLLPREFPRFIKGYKVTYKGKKEAIPPIRNLRVLEWNESAFKVSFRDSTGDVFAEVLPLDVFVKQDSSKEQGPGHIHPTSDEEVSGNPLKEMPDIDLEYTEEFLNENVMYLKPQHINNRLLFGLEFESLKDSTKKFLLYPEAESNEDMGNIIAHPSRRIYWDKDIYVHVSSIPNEGAEEPRFRYHSFQLRIGDTARVGDAVLKLARVTDLTGNKELEDFVVAAAAYVEVIKNGRTYVAKPVYMIGKDNRPGMKEDRIDPLYMDFAFVNVDPEKGLINIQVQEQTNPESDWVVIKALSKPYINLLWLGTFILAFGFGISIYRRIQENRKLRKS